jgi:hypothetical protein
VLPEKQDRAEEEKIRVALVLKARHDALQYISTIREIKNRISVEYFRSLRV